MISAKHQKLSDRIQKERSCKRSSARVYSSNLHRIHREFLSDTNYSQDLKWLKNNGKRLLSKLKKIENINTQRNLLAAALVGFDLLKMQSARDPYVEQIAVLNEKQKNLPADRTPKQQAKYVDWGKIIKLRRLLTRTVRLGKYYSRKKLLRKEFQSLQQNLVLHLYTEIPPVRNDWSTVRFMTSTQWDDLTEEEKKASNILVMGRGAFHVYWADYKTVKKHGVIQQLIPKKLQALLKKHIKFLKLHFPDSDHLLLGSTGQPMSRNGLTKFLQRLFYTHFRTKTSTSALRSIFLTHKFDKKQLDEQVTIAKAMHHTPAVARQFYVKNK
jgi:hypothetical protein